MICTEQSRKDGLQLIIAAEKGDVQTTKTLLTEESGTRSRASVG